MQLGLPGFRVKAGDIVYLGDLVINFEKDKFPGLSWSTTTRDEATVAAIMNTTPFGDRLVVRQAGYLGK